MYCPNCGKRIPKSANVCPFCGYHVKHVINQANIDLRQPVRLTPKTHNKKAWIIGIICVVVLLLVGIHLKNQYITPNIELSKTATSRTWIVHDRLPYESSKDANMKFHKNGSFIDKIGNDDHDPETGYYKFGKNTLMLSHFNNGTDSIKLKCTKYSHGEYIYTLVQYDNTSLSSRYRNKCHIIFKEK